MLMFKHPHWNIMTVYMLIVYTQTLKHHDCVPVNCSVVWSCFPFIRSGQNHFARHSERGKKTRWTKEEVGRQHQGMDWPGVRQIPEGSGEQGKMEKTGCKIICGAPTTLTVKGLMIMMMMMNFYPSGPFTCIFSNTSP